MQQYHLKNSPNREIKSEEEINEIIASGKFTVISMCRDNEPYVVSLSYGSDPENNALYFHAAKEGLKLDFIKANPMVCATIIEDRGYRDNDCSHAFRSVVFWGTMKIVNELEEKKYGMEVLLKHLEKKEDIIKKKILQSEKCYDRMEILRLNIEQIHGKKDIL